MRSPASLAAAGDFEYLAFGPETGSVDSLAVLLHGFGRNAFYMQKMADELRARLPQAMILCPHGPDRINLDGMRAGDADNHLHIPEEVITGDDGNHPDMLREWFRIDGNLAALMPRLSAVAERMNAFIDLQRDFFGLRDNKVALMGFSQGAGVALHTACARATPLGCLVSHSGIILDPVMNGMSVRSMPETLFLYGRQDREFSQEIFARSAAWLDRVMPGKVCRKTVPGLGHYTNMASRGLCADFIQSALG